MDAALQKIPRRDPEPSHPRHRPSSVNGMRRTLERKPIKLMRWASSEGIMKPVQETVMIRSTSSGRRPARCKHFSAASRPSLTACSMYSDWSETERAVQWCIRSGKWSVVCAPEHGRRCSSWLRGGAPECRRCAHIIFHIVAGDCVRRKGRGGSRDRAMC